MTQALDRDVQMILQCMSWLEFTQKTMRWSNKTWRVTLHSPLPAFCRAS
jgi:hypothetical protein